MYCLFENLNECNTVISQRLKERLQERVKERRDSKLYNLMHYLENPNFIYNTRDMFGERISKSNIRYASNL